MGDGNLGFTIDKDSLPALRRFKGVKRVDPAKGDTKVSVAKVSLFEISKQLIRYTDFSGHSIF